MKILKSIILVTFLAFISFNQAEAKDAPSTKTAEEVLEYAGTLDDLTKENKILLKAEIKSLSLKERIKLAKISYKQVKEAKKTGETTKAKGGLYVLAIVLPPVAVGIHTEWGSPTVYNVIWTICGILPGIIHAFVVLGR